MRFVALCVLVACTSAEKGPPDREAEWQALEKKYAPIPGEWESVVRILSVSRRQAIDDPKTKADVAKAMSSALADTEPTRVIPDVAAAKDLPELVDAAQLLFDTATTPDDPSRLVALANDMRQRGTLLRAFVAMEILRAAAKWSVEHKTKLPALEAIQPTPLDFIQAVGREVVFTTHLVEADLADKKNAQAARQVKELHAFVVERLTKLEEKPTDVAHLRKHSNWRDEPDALDHPLIRVVAQNFGPRLDAFDDLQTTLQRLRMGTLKPKVAEPTPEPTCTKFVVKGIKGSGLQREIPKAEVERVFENAACFAEDARVVPFFEGGKCTGFKIFGIAKGSVFEQLGFENGDIVETLNGLEMTSPDNALVAYEKVKTASHAEVVVKRKNAKVTLVWRAK